MALSPMMSQYLETKKQYNDCILFYRLGDFYEMFFEDAKIASRELEITLTGKDCGLEERAPMCGVPFHAVDTYLNRLVSKGYKVAIAEQMEDPKLAKGIVKREVIRIVTPGTNINSLALDETKNNYLMCVYYAEDSFTLSFVDITTGDFQTTHIDSPEHLFDEINKFPVAEIISNQAFLMTPVDFDYLRDKLGITCYTLSDPYFENDSCLELIKKHFHVLDIAGLGLKDIPGSVPCTGALLKYLYETQKTSLEFLNRITTYHAGRYMSIDHATRRNLELTETMREKSKKGSLLWVLDKTKTAMGARMLRSFLEQPLVDAAQIEKRLDAVQELNGSLIDRDEIREYLNPVYDLERLLARISYRSANPRDLIAFKNSLEMLPFIKQLLHNFSSPLLKEICEELDPLEDLYQLIDESISEDAPITIKEGGIIKQGYSERIDKLRDSKIEGKNWLSKLEEKERSETDIKGLKIRYNKVFGYYIEVTNSFRDKVPEHYIRKQTLVNAERYITQELKELEDMILGAEEKLFSYEYDLFNDIREQIAGQLERIHHTAHAVSGIDTFCSLAYVAEHNKYVRPSINMSGTISITDGRHPVVEMMMEEGRFIPNDAYSDRSDNRVSIITGPNMAGKSTYMRQLALIVLMAAIGSFVPASAADICTCDRIFTRVGASDDLASGQSTFMVEMTEVANILRNATSDSLIILDEIGRGTSTYDGMSIAWAVVEYIADRTKCGAKTFFSTHYHELTELEGRIGGVKNYCISVMEQGEDIIFLRKIKRGGADKSYGIQVARLAGVPDEIIDRAKEIVVQLTEADIAGSSPSERIRAPKADAGVQDKTGQFVLTTADDIVHRKLKGIEPDKLTPLEAINILYELKSLL